MKIYITGPSASGKTTLAKAIARATGIRCHHSDLILFQHPPGQKRIELKKREYEPKIKQILQKKDWIFDGRHLFVNLLKQADIIIFINQPFTKAIARQWKRFFQDRKQRELYGLKENLKLSAKIFLRQYFGKVNRQRLNDPKYTHQKKLKKLMDHYLEKLIVLDNDQRYQAFISLFSQEQT